MDVDKTTRELNCSFFITTNHVPQAKNILNYIHWYTEQNCIFVNKVCKLYALITCGCSVMQYINHKMHSFPQFNN